MSFIYNSFNLTSSWLATAGHFAAPKSDQGWQKNNRYEDWRNVTGWLHDSVAVWLQIQPLASSWRRQNETSRRWKIQAYYRLRCFFCYPLSMTFLTHHPNTLWIHELKMETEKERQWKAENISQRKVVYFYSIAYAWIEREILLHELANWAISTCVWEILLARTAKNIKHVWKSSQNNFLKQNLPALAWIQRAGQWDQRGSLIFSGLRTCICILRIIQSPKWSLPNENLVSWINLEPLSEVDFNTLIMILTKKFSSRLKRLWQMHTQV